MYVRTFLYLIHFIHQTSIELFRNGRRIIVVDFDDNDIANCKMIICNDDFIGIIIYDIFM